MLPFHHPASILTCGLVSGANYSFCDLMKRIGIQNILVLVDSIDIKPTSQHLIQSKGNSPIAGATHIDRMVAIVTPLLQVIKDDLWGEHVYWKLFLPLELYLPLIDRLSLSIQYHIIEWDRKRLLEFLKFRLSSASNGAITSLNQLVSRDVSANLELYLCAASESSPRYLMHYINKLFAFHVNTTNDEHLPGKISSQSLSKIPYIAQRPVVPTIPV